MTNFANALRQGLRQANRQAGELVTYRRGTTTAQITAIRGAKQVEQTDTAGNSSVQTIRHDWIVTDDQMQLPSGVIQPIEGDEIVDSLSVRFRVVKHPSDGKCSRVMPHNVGTRIHCVIVEGEK